LDLVGAKHKGDQGKIFAFFPKFWEKHKEGDEGKKNFLSFFSIDFNFCIKIFFIQKLPFLHKKCICWFKNG
jgi:hypothetical protein